MWLTSSTMMIPNEYSKICGRLVMVALVLYIMPDMFSPRRLSLSRKCRTRGNSVWKSGKIFSRKFGFSGSYDTPTLLSIKDATSENILHGSVYIFQHFPVSFCDQSMFQTTICLKMVDSLEQLTDLFNLF